MCSVNKVTTKKSTLPKRLNSKKELNRNPRDEELNKRDQE